MFSLAGNVDTSLLAYCHRHDDAHRPGHHDGAHRRYVRHLLHRGKELHRRTRACTATLLGDGLATSLAAIFGAPANTTYGENTGVLALTKVYDPTRDPHRGRARRPVLLLSQVCRAGRLHAHGHHRRRVA